jgi:drug/metabolite transporter (DMT)-like permease
VTRRGWLLFWILAVIWGIPYLLIKVAVAEITPATLVFLRTALGATLLLPLAMRRGELRSLLPHWRPIVAFAVVEMAVPWFLLSDAERHLSSSLAGLLIAAVPLVGAVLSRITGGQERFGGRRLAGLLVGLAGVVALLGLDVSTSSARAVLEMIVVVVCYAAGPLIISRRLAGLSSRLVMTASIGLCALGYAPYVLLHLPPALPSARAIAAVVVLGVVCTALAFIVFFHLIAEAGPVRATVVTYVNPAVAVALGVGLLGEPLTPGIVLGFVLILAGSYLATRPARASERTGLQPSSSQ